MMNMNEKPLECQFCKMQFSERNTIDDEVVACPSDLGRAALHSVSFQELERRFNNSDQVVEGHYLKTRMVPLRVAVDAVLCKLSEAKPGDVLVIRAEFPGDGFRLQRQICEHTMPAGSLPKGGVPVVVAQPGVEWSLEQPVEHPDADKQDAGR